MKIDNQIQAINFSLDNKLKQFIKKKISKLFLFDNNISRLNIYLKVARPESHKNKISEIKLFSSDLAIFAKKQANSFEESIDLVCEALRKQIIKNKKK